MADELEPVDPAATPAEAAVAVELDALAAAPSAGPGAPLAVGDLTPLLDVPLEVIVEIGRTKMKLRETLAIGPGSIVTLEKLVGEPADVLVNGRRIARGEVVAVDEEFGVRVTEIL